METPHQRAPGNVSPVSQCSDLARPNLAWSVVPRRKPRFLTKGLRSFEMVLWGEGWKGQEISGHLESTEWMKFPSSPGSPHSEVAQDQAEGRALARNLQQSRHTCPTSARQGCLGTSMGQGGLCISMPPPSCCQPVMLPGHGGMGGVLSPCPLNFSGFHPEFTALQGALSQGRMGAGGGDALSRNWDF